jgi:hypothetical protein
MTVAFLQTVPTQEADLSKLRPLRKRVLGLIPAVKSEPGR